ncbi:hypothetical protein ABPG72_019979 [Tetrahymena utriculariae]
MDLQNISEQFLEFLDEQEIDVPEDFIQIFYSSILLDQWISSELAQKYLEYSRKDVFNKTLNKFTVDQDYKEITKEQHDETYPTLRCEQYYIEELQERDQQQLQLEAEIQELNVQHYYRCNVYKIFKENPLQPQVICFSSNIEKSIHRYQKLLNNFYNEQFDYNYEILGQNLTRQEAIELKQETILELTGQQKIQHYNIQRIIPLFE